MAIQILHPEVNNIDERGGIIQLVDSDDIPFRCVLRITSKAGTIRSNHYHKKDSHYIYIENGRCEYSEKPSDEPNAPIETVILGPGDLVLSKPGIIHAVKFLEDTILYAFTTEKRHQKQYEEDTIRVKIVE